MLEQSLRDAGVDVVEPGYRAGQALVADNVALGLDVVVDAVNGVEAARRGWRAATGAGRVVEVHLTCAPDEHRRRVEARQPDIEGLVLPTWDQVVARRFDPWPEALRVDLSAMGPVEATRHLLAATSA